MISGAALLLLAVYLTSTGHALLALPVLLCAFVLAFWALARNEA
ncbi:hypothetical protein ACFP81_10505 [Deinococcus lacus]|uniref:Uncharacterized protein n=1 Tax=Deinococcus lacus TaxID=392561 RepID=A0ABW1YDP3_9DEIO